MSSPQPGSLLSIGELARRVGAAPSALRYWERAGLLEPAARVGGRRRYGPEAITRVGLIRLCQDAGFGIGETRDLLDADPKGLGEWRMRAHAKLADVQDQIARLQATAELLEHTLACPHPSLAVCPTFAAFVQWRAGNGPRPELPA